MPDVVDKLFTLWEKQCPGVEDAFKMCMASIQADQKAEDVHVQLCDVISNPV